jgi:hypothetical protein
LAACCWEEHVIILGCVVGLVQAEEKYRTQQYSISSGSDTGKTNSGRSFTEDNIDPCCKPRRVCSPCHSPQLNWERQKQVLIHEACLASGWKDFSGVVGKSMSEAGTYLTKIGLKLGKESYVQGFKDPQALMSLVASVISCAPEGKTIDLILSEKDCVLFALPAKDK